MHHLAFFYISQKLCLFGKSLNSYKGFDMILPSNYSPPSVIFQTSINYLISQQLSFDINQLTSIVNTNCPILNTEQREFYKTITNRVNNVNTGPYISHHHLFFLDGPGGMYFLIITHYSNLFFKLIIFLFTGTGKHFYTTQ